MALQYYSGTENTVQYIQWIEIDREREKEREREIEREREREYVFDTYKYINI